MAKRHITASCAAGRCLRPALAGALCHMHHKRLVRHTALVRPGDIIEEGPKCAPVAARREARRRWDLSEGLVTPEPNTGCLLWLGAMSGAGYGVLGDDEGPWGGYAHRAALYFAGLLQADDARYALHGCDNPACVRVGDGHLYVGTALDNARDRDKRGRDRFTRARLAAPLHDQHLSQSAA
jgi:hypothetical protein